MLNNIPKVGILYLGRRKVMDGSCPYFKAHSVWPSGFFDTKNSVNTPIQWESTGHVEKMTILVSKWGKLIEVIE